MGLFFRDGKAGQVDLDNLPCHVAVIMDGNGRWAQKRGLPRSAGHKAGAEAFRRLGTYCKKLGIDYLTVYAFSTENWKRPPEEIEGIMRLLEQYLHECIDTMERDGNRLRFLGDLSVLTPELRQLIDETNEISSRITGFQANVCLNYGGRDELLHAARAFARDCVAGKADAESLTEERFARYLYSDGLPDPDLLIRPGGEKRVSNYLLWQCAYSEFYFCDTLWPDFDEKAFDKALIAYQHRERRFGGIKQEERK